MECFTGIQRGFSLCGEECQELQLALVSQQAPDLIGKLLHLYGDYLCVLSQLQHAGHCLLVQLDQLDTSTACCVCLEGFAAFSQVGSFQFSSVQSLSHVRFFVTP